MSISNTGSRRLRPATAADAPALLSIYAPYVEHSAVTFEYKVPTTAEFTRRIEEITVFYPYLVWEENGKILGYAYAHRHKERAAYQWNVELSIYLDQNARRRGIGSMLYSALIELLLLQGVQNFYACVTQPNAASDALHRKMGFSPCSTWHRSGYKLGEWHDVTWYEMNISISDTPPALRSIQAVSAGRIQSVLDKYSVSAISTCGCSTASSSPSSPASAVSYGRETPVNDQPAENV